MKVAKHAVQHILGAASDPGEQPAAEILFDDCGYTLKTYDMWLDADEFEQRCDNGHGAAARDDQATAVEQYGRALELYSGDFLQGLSAEWAREQQDSLRSLALGAAEYLLRDALCRDDLPQVIALSRRTLDIDPYQEDVYRTLIQVHGELGQLGQAKAWYDLCRRRMSGELGIDISADTQRVFQRMTGVRKPRAASRPGT
ncbi:bacterial transcriptional activator domain-containing protein [Streptomyces sp. NPDC047082]|uniref:AfsR/SARP family transcriptional regulator n=1 Tax=Streptomyces sp. NPDC047082 TaxID=3155259 RepID=UPI0033D5939A